MDFSSLIQGTRFSSVRTSPINAPELFKGDTLFSAQLVLSSLAMWQLMNAWLRWSLCISHFSPTGTLVFRTGLGGDPVESSEDKEDCGLLGTVVIWGRLLRLKLKHGLQRGSFSKLLPPVVGDRS
ncbi:hypothetical protein GN956_G18513 [Arapaima gigas]